MIKKLTAWLRKQSRRTIITLAGIAVVLLVIILGAAQCAAGQNKDSENGSVFPVARGPLTISVRDTGTIKPTEQEIISCELEGRTTILYLIPEGTRVHKGELLVELDASGLEDEKVDQQIRVQNAEAAYIQSRENLEVTKNQAQSDIDKAELTLRFAEEDLEQYTDGKFPNELKEQEARIVLAKEELQRSEEELKWSKVLYDEKYLAESELKADELAAKKAALDVELAANNLSLLKDYTYKRQIAQLESDLKQAEMALERVKRKASADMVQANTNLRAKESEFNRQKGKLEKIEDQIGKAKITAPRDGLVVYATSTQFRWHRSSEPLSEGQEVREREELIYLPTASTFKAEMSIHESNLEKIRMGLPVRITVDAVPDRKFIGKISYIAPLADATSMFMNPDLKVYKTEVTIEGGGDVLRTGMSCNAEIVVEHYENALYIPVQTVIKVDGKPTVYVRKGKKVGPRTIKTGLDDNVMVHVIAGLEEGEEVLLAPPLDAGGNGKRKDSGPIAEELKPTATPAVHQPKAEKAGEKREIPKREDGQPGKRRPGSGRESGRGNLGQRNSRRSI